VSYQARPSEPSLATAYWLHGVVGNAAISIVVSRLWGDRVPLGVLIFWGAYNVWNMLLIWDTSSRYTGRAIWRGLARAVAIITAAMVLLVAINIFAEIAHRAKDLQPDKSVIGQLLG